MEIISGHALPGQMDRKTENCVEERKTGILVLILRHLHDHGYLQSYRSLCGETGVNLEQIDAADNVDLTSVVQAYEDFYEGKYGRRPKLARSVSSEVQQQPTQAHAIQSATEHVGAVEGGYGIPTYTPFYANPHNMMTSFTQGTTDLGTTRRIGTNAAVSQEELVQTLGQLSEADPSQAFTFLRPRRNAGTKRSMHLRISELQEKILYALVGCIGIGWNIKAISADSRDFLANTCGINKEMLQLFFKNRSKKTRRDRGKQPRTSQTINGGLTQNLQSATVVPGQVRHAMSFHAMGHGLAHPAQIHTMRPQTPQMMHGHPMRHAQPQMISPAGAVQSVMSQVSSPQQNAPTTPKDVSPRTLQGSGGAYSLNGLDVPPADSQESSALQAPGVVADFGGISCGVPTALDASELPLQHLLNPGMLSHQMIATPSHPAMFMNGHLASQTHPAGALDQLQTQGTPVDSLHSVQSLLNVPGDI